MPSAGPGRPGPTESERIRGQAVNPVERVIRGADSFQQRHRWTAFGFGVVKKFGDDNGGALVSNLVYSAFISVFPLLLILVTVLVKVAAGDPKLRASVISGATRAVPLYRQSAGQQHSRPDDREHAGPHRRPGAPGVGRHPAGPGRAVHDGTGLEPAGTGPAGICAQADPIGHLPGRARRRPDRQHGPGRPGHLRKALPGRRRGGPAAGGPGQRGALPGQLPRADAERGVQPAAPARRDRRRPVLDPGPGARRLPGAPLPAQRLGIRRVRHRPRPAGVDLLRRAGVRVRGRGQRRHHPAAVAQGDRAAAAH